MSTKKNHEGYLLLDHRESPGVPEAQLASAGLPLNAGRGIFEAATYTCSHCCRVVVINTLRTREREYCIKCNHYICDSCGATKALTGECKTFKQIMDEGQAAAVQRLIYQL